MNGAQIFSEGDFLRGTLTWGWQCFGCGAEDRLLASATSAREKADDHANFCVGAS